MKNTLYPESGTLRREKAVTRRKKIAERLDSVKIYPTADNGDNAKHSDTYLTAFTKGLAHNDKGIVEQSEFFDTFQNALTQPGSSGETQPEFNVPQATKNYFENTIKEPLNRRVWESPLAGMAYENQGPDPDMVSMAPAPKLGESELSAELLEVYAMALVRDIPFSKLDNATTELIHYDDKGDTGTYEVDGCNAKVGDLISILNSLDWFKSPEAVTSSLGRDSQFTKHERRRQKARGENSPNLTVKSLFRGSSPGCKEGPYISQFILQGAGNTGPGGDSIDPKSGSVQFGAQSVSQKIHSNRKGVDWMSDWTEWLAVQDGTDVSGADIANTGSKFIQTPRDLATYVHVDQLYQAYFVACLILLNKNVAGDPGFPEPNRLVNTTRSPFATFGGPHILSQMTEVASRALRAVRRQKFQIHRRARPEQLAAMITLAANDLAATGSAKRKMQSMLTELGLGDEPMGARRILDWIDELNQRQSKRQRPYQLIKGTKIKFTPEKGRNFLLPMAFPEGSPMHPSYGAGHATVAGACSTVLKAFFGIYDVAKEDLSGALKITPFKPKTMQEIGMDGVFEADSNNGDTLVKSSVSSPITIEGELNKLAANISIGRNFAGVHYYSDYYDSLRMGERVAIGMLKEHLDAHPEPVAMHLRGFDGENIYLSGDGHGESEVHIWNEQGNRTDFQKWWTRDVVEFERRPDSTEKIQFAKASSGVVTS